MTLADYRKKRGEPLIREDADGAHDDTHPSALEYVQIGIILAIITAVEVALYYLDLDFTLLVTLLLMLSVVKFGMVVLWFMHLKFDASLFAILFAGGLALTFVVFAVAIAALGGSLT
ncbi:MAG: cytochrome C oxidase subunit IV family protein [Chloroflexi bacterium]|nr:cytochrome C oxidase subunit IV family protein [Chloroflexota bacterium]